jgi:hypothetical protein
VLAEVARLENDRLSTKVEDLADQPCGASNRTLAYRCAVPKWVGETFLDLPPGNLG